MAKPHAIVQMTKTFNTNTAGDVCAFSRAVADELVAKGAAVFKGEIDVASETWVDGKAVALKRA